MHHASSTHLTAACKTAEIMRGPPLAPIARTSSPSCSAISGLMLLNGFLPGLRAKWGEEKLTMLATFFKLRRNGDWLQS
jgi:hypothetical protein